MAENTTLSPEQWKAHLLEQRMPDNYVSYILGKIEQETSTKISLTFMASPQSGTRYDIMNETLANTHRVSVYSKKEFLKIGQQYLSELQIAL